MGTPFGGKFAPSTPSSKTLVVLRFHVNAPKYPRLYAAQYHVFKVVSSLLFVCTFFFQCSYFVSSVQPSIAQPTAAAILSRGNENVSYLGSRWIGWTGLFPP